MPELGELFDELVQEKGSKKLPPVEDWKPSRTGKIDIFIDAWGDWYHEGDPIKRQEIINLFSTIMRKDEDGYCLVTPSEKLLIKVEDVPFVVVEMATRGENVDRQLVFRTNVNEVVTANDSHRLWVTNAEKDPRPYLHIRSGLNALLSRPVYYQLMDLCIWDNDNCYIYSADTRFDFLS